MVSVKSYAPLMKYSIVYVRIGVGLVEQVHRLAMRPPAPLALEPLSEDPRGKEEMAAALRISVTSIKINYDLAAAPVKSALFTLYMRILRLLPSRRILP